MRAAPSVDTLHSDPFFTRRSSNVLKPTSAASLKISSMEEPYDGECSRVPPAAAHGDVQVYVRSRLTGGEPCIAVWRLLAMDKYEVEFLS